MREHITKRLYQTLDLAKAGSFIEEEYPNSWNMEEFKALNSFNKRIGYCESNLQRISSGSSRIVYRIDETKVLKLAKNSKGIVQNETEIEWGKDGYYGHILAKTLDNDPKALWVEMELARKVTPALFKAHMGVTINVLDDYIQNFVAKNNGKEGAFEIPPNDLSIMQESEDINILLSFIHGTDAMASDLGRLSSWGLVKRDGVDKVVIIDFGLTHDSYDSYYR